jgi:release factor glutamine methyltransferase
MTTCGEALAEGRAALANGNVESAALDARLLLAAAAGLDMAALIARSDETLSELAHATFRDHVRRRLNGEPVARIIGETEFWGLSIKLSPATLVPRPDTETLVEVVLDEARRRRPPDITICDLGTGSGAIAIALLRELPQARAVATDISEEALRMARSNAERLGVLSRVSFRRTSFAEGPEGRFDVVVANPPYVRSDAIGSLQREVRDYDPRAALDGGADGLNSYRAILSRAGALLAPGGFLAFEVGHDQGEAVAALCRKAGLSEVRILKDLGGRWRVVTASASMSGTIPEAPKKALGKVE